MSPLFKPGINCWRIAKATGVRFHLESDQYYRALYETLPHARKSVFIAGWDFDFRTNLTRDGFSKEKLRDLANSNSQIGELLQKMMKANKDLQVYILIWAHPPLYAPDREAFAEAKAWLTMPGQLHFRRDDLHPFGASQHQKLVVIDDQIAFVGGMDISSARWDTMEHIPNDPRRNDHVFSNYRPYHDVQAQLQGPVVKDLYEVFLYRWLRCNSELIEDQRTSETLPLVRSDYDFKDIEVAVARTHPRFQKEKPIREIEKLYVDLIAAAQDEIYFENQYIASDTLVEKLCERVSEKNGPRITFIMPGHPMDWIEEKSMGSLKSAMVRSLLESAYEENRIGIFYPQSGRGKNSEIKVHSKVMIVDNRIIRLGSSNFNNRSLGLDMELDIAIEPDSNMHRVREIKHELLSGFISIPKEQITRELAENPNINCLARKYQDTERRLVEVKPRELSKFDQYIRSYKILDTKNTTKLERLLEQVFLEDSALRWRSVVFSILGAFLFCGLVSFAIYFTNSPEFIQEKSLPSALRLLANLDEAPMSWLWILLGFGLFGALVIPLNLYILAVATIYPPHSAILLSVLGALIAGSVSFAFGWLAGPRLLRKISWHHFDRLTNILAGGGWMAIALIRMIPIAPYGIVNIACGSFRITYWNFALGTTAGVLPGIITIVLFQQSLLAFIQNPSMSSLVVSLTILFVVFFFLRALQRRFLGGQFDVPVGSE